MTEQRNSHVETSGTHTVDGFGSFYVVENVSLEGGELRLLKLDREGMTNFWSGLEETRRVNG
jgi:hypothetical protein